MQTKKPFPSKRSRSSDDSKNSSDRKKPAGARGKPTGARGKPTGARGKPTGARGKPTGTRGKPTGARGKPTGTRGKPTGARERPEGATNRSVETRRSTESKPRTFGAKPKSFETKPRTFGAKPKSFETKPRTFEPKPKSVELTPRASEPARPFYIWGRHPVEAWLAKAALDKHDNASKSMLHIIADKTGRAPSQCRAVVESAQALGIRVQLHKGIEDGWPLNESDEENLNHQRVCLKVPFMPLGSFEDACGFVKAASAAKICGCVGIVLDQVQDPRNFGAILRSAAFFEQKFVVFAKDRAAQMSPYVIKSSAGGAFQVELVQVPNLNRALDALKECGAWIVGAALGEGSSDLNTLPIDRPYVLVLGNESKGLRHEISKHCDYIAKIRGGNSLVDSLNVSVATGIFLQNLTRGMNFNQKSNHVEETEE